MVNKVTLIGRLGKDPQVKHFQNDTAIAEFSVATTENYKDRDGNWKEITDWHNVKLPNKFMAERAEKNLKKGMLVYIEGKIRTRNYDDKDGNKRYVTEVVADQFRSLERKGDGGGGSGDGGSSYSAASSPSNEESTTSSRSNTNTNSSNTSSNNNVDDDLPF